MGFNDINIQVSGPQQPASIYKTKVLKGQVPFATQVTEPNTKYVIKHNFVLNGDVTIPENCILEFDGGSISGEHTITGANTGIEAGLVKIFNTNVTLAGTWNVAEAYPEWFGAKGDGITDDTVSIQKTIDLGVRIHFCEKTYVVTSTLHIDCQDIVGSGASKTTLRVNGDINLFEADHTSKWRDRVFGAELCGFRVLGENDTGYNSAVFYIPGLDTNPGGNEYWSTCHIHDLIVYQYGRIVHLCDCFNVTVDNILSYNVVQPIYVYGACIQCNFSKIYCFWNTSNPNVITQLDYYGFYNIIKRYRDNSIRHSESIIAHHCGFVRYNIGLYDESGGLLHSYYNMDLDSCRNTGALIGGDIRLKDSWICLANDCVNGYAVRIPINGIYIRQMTVLENCEIMSNNTDDGNGNYGILVGGKTGSGTFGMKRFGVHIIGNTIGKNSSQENMFTYGIRAHNQQAMIVRDNMIHKVCTNPAIYINGLISGVVEGNISSYRSITVTIHQDAEEGNYIVQGNAVITEGL